MPVLTLTGRVATADGIGLADTAVSIGAVTAVSASDGSFIIETAVPGAVTVSRPAWQPTVIEWDGTPTPVDITLEPLTVRALRLSNYEAQTPEEISALLGLADNSAVNAIVIDAKDEAGTVTYASTVPEAERLGAIEARYDLNQLLGAAAERELYTIARVATFEDKLRTDSDPEAKLAGNWVNLTDVANWEYPLDLATELCDLGFDEIQFDYVRFPAGFTAAAAQRNLPTTAQQRVDTVTAFLAEASSRLHPKGCAVAAAIFGIVLSGETDEGVGQRPEEISAVVDVVSPMVYPDLYADGWLGLAEPHDHPVAVTARALDAGVPRIAGDAVLRPYLQAFGYSPSQILSAIGESEARGLGWMLWNPGARYSAEALPDS
jgi:hypothetical protein